MAQYNPRERPRVLIVEDQIMIALDLEATMLSLGFDSRGLAPSDRRARSLAMSDLSDVVLMDVCLEGGREGIETGRWLTANNDEGTLARIHERVPGAPVLSKPVYRKTTCQGGIRGNPLGSPRSPEN